MSELPVRCRATLSVLAAALLLAGCKDRGSDDPANTKEPHYAAAEQPVGEIVIPAASARYTPGRAGTGAVSGTVTLASPLAAAAPVHAGSDSLVCGPVIPDSSLVQRGSGLGGVVVWLDGPRSGKPIPLERRLELESNNCQLSPRVQGAVVGSAVNVIGHDDFRQHLTFMAGQDRIARARVLLSAYEQVIPTELPMRTPGLVYVRDADHPWVRSYLAVFDHPYWQVTGPDGAFSIDGVPAGTYTLMAWHERTKTVRQKVTVGVGASRVEVRMVGR